MVRTSSFPSPGGKTIFIRLSVLAFLKQAHSLKVTIAYILKYEMEAWCLHTCNNIDKTLALIVF